MDWRDEIDGARSAGFWVSCSAAIIRPTGTSMRRFLLLIPFFATLAVPLYNRSEPALLGFPFFYWYLFLWLFLLPPLIWIVYRGRRP